MNADPDREDLALALRLADLADAVTMERFRAANLVVETKPDLTPVTDADRAVEELLRTHVAAERPGHLGVGVELGGDGPGGPGSARWIIDPIDATKNYVRGIPVFATLIALERDGGLVLGVVSAPALGRRWWAARGQGAFANGAPIHVSRVARLADALLGHSSISSWEAAGLGDRFMELERRCWHGRGFGDFWMHMLVAEGGVDVAAEPEVSLWDVAPVQVIVEEAGGRFTSLRGVARPDGGSAVSSNGLLHDQTLAILAPPAAGS
jgi:histidinol-phosphatase